MSSVPSLPIENSNQNFSEAESLIQEAISDRVFPGAVLAVNRGGVPLLKKSFGFRSADSAVSDGEEGTEKAVRPPLSIDCVFDIGELTIPFVTTTSILLLAKERRISLEDKVARYVQEFGVFGKSKITVQQVMNHTAGLIPLMPFHEDLSRVNTGSRVGILSTRSSREVVLRAINRSKLKHDPGSKYAYSQVGMILLGFLIETLRGQGLDAAAKSMIFNPLMLRSTSYVDTARLRRQEITAVSELIAPTEDCPWRKRVLCGEVHDENAWALGGVAGHAGVFSSVSDLSTFADEVLRSYHGQSDFLDREILARSFCVDTAPEDSWALGWDTPREDNGLAGVGLPAEARGVISGTGCAMWLLPAQGVSIVLLTNRLNQNRSDRKFASFFPKVMSKLVHAL